MTTYRLMHKNVIAAIVVFEDETPTDITVVNIEQMPVGAVFRYKQVVKCDIMTFRRWWSNRVVPSSRTGVQRLLKANNVKTVGNYALQNLGLSLTDCYWLCPINVALSWEHVNFFVNICTTLRIGASVCTPDSTLSGNMPKYWRNSNGVYYLYKQADNIQRAYNEIFALQVHMTQAKRLMQDVVPYTVQQIGQQMYTVCPNICTGTVELIHATDLLNSTKCFDNQTTYVTLKPLLQKYGLTEEYIDNYFDYMLMFDFVISNIDRHMKNIAVLRNADTLQVYALAPLYDNGDSMFVNGLENVTEHELLAQETSSFYKRAVDNLKLVRNRSAFNIQAAPKAQLIESVYKGCTCLNTQQIETMTRLYNMKLNYLWRFQRGENIWNLVR